MNPHRRDRLFRAAYETPADTGAGAAISDEDEPFEPSTEITFEDEGSVGRQVRESAGLTHRNARGQFTREGDDDTIEGSGPPALEAPPAAPAESRTSGDPTAPVAPAAPPATGEPPVDVLGAPPPRGTLNEDGSVTLANGHTYANTQAAIDALWHAQDTISRGIHKQPEPQIPAAPLEEEEQAGMLLGAGAPIGGEPQTLQELYDWAESDPAAAGRFVVANQHRVGVEHVRKLYEWWGQNDSADRDAYNAELNVQRAQQQAAEIEERIAARYEPFVRAHEQAEIDKWDKELKALPYFEHYEQRVGAEIQNDPEFLAEYAKMPAAEKFHVCKQIYAGLRVDDSIAAVNGQAPAAAAPGGATAVVQQAAAATATAPPVVEGRGGAAPPPINRNDPHQLMMRGVKAYQQAGNLFSPDAPAS